MPLAEKLNTFTADDYLLWEEAADVKHEYIAGEVFAHAGARDSHVTVTMNLAMLLLSHLRGKPCRVYMAEMKVRAEEADAFFYPDVFVTCDPRDSETPLYKSYPSVIIEVLSESTSSFDYGRKFAMYRTIDSLREYILVDPDTLSAECFRKDSTGHWVLYPVGKGELFEIPQISFAAPLEELYENVNFGEYVAVSDVGRKI
jgi:Uma2 family endonuclease